MTVVKKLPNKKAETVDIDNKLEALQKAVGGYLEAVHTSSLHPDICILCDEEGWLKDLEPNLDLTGYNPGYKPFIIAGPVLFVGVEADGEDFCSLTEKQIERIERWLKTCVFIR